jgi:hypothetical protein
MNVPSCLFTSCQLATSSYLCYDYATFKEKVKMFGLFKKKTDSTGGEEETRRFFSVSLSEKMVQAALWETQENVKVLSKSENKPYFNDNDLLVKLDGCLQELGPEGEVVHQTLFHLDNSFISGQEIASDKKDLFKKITDALQLESLGFVTHTEAVINARLEQNPNLGQQLVMEFTKSKIIFSLYEKKKLLETISEETKGNFCEKVKGALVQLASQLKADYSPCFIEKKELEPGSEELPPLFINFISALETSEELNDKVALLPSSLPVRTEILGSDILLTYTLIPSATIIARSYGWLQEIEAEEEVASEAEMASEPPLAAADADNDPLPQLSRQRLVLSTKVTDADLEPETEEEDKPSPRRSNKLNRNLVVKAAVLGVILGLLVVVGAAFYTVLAQAQVTVEITPKTSSLAKNLEVVIDPKATTADYENLVLPGTIEDREIVHTLTIPTTGKKDMGDPARGKIEITNKKTDSRTLAKGTEIENGTVSFTLNDEIILEPAAETADGLTFSKKEANVTAITRGIAGNVKKETVFRVGSYVKEELEARAVEDFSGGTEKFVAIYDEADQKALLAQMDDALAQAAINQIGNKKDDTYLAVQLDKLKISSTVYSLKIGDEGSEVTLEAKAKVPVIAYKLDELGPLAKSVLERDLEPGWRLVGNDPSLLSPVNEEKTENGGGKIYLDVNLSQAVEREVDVEALSRAILGQEVEKVRNYLSNSDVVKEYDIFFSNKLSQQIFGKLPKDPDNLIVEVKSSQ